MKIISDDMRLMDAYMMFSGLRNIKRYPPLFSSDELAHDKTVLVD
jgi:hypothetical protein